MEALDKILGIIGYAVVSAEDGSVEEVKGSSTTQLGDLSAFFSSAAEVIRNSLSLGKINYISLSYGACRLVIFPYNTKYIGIEIPREEEPANFIEKIRAAVVVPEKAAAPEIELPRSIGSKLQQINLLIEELASDTNKDRWVELLNQGLAILGGELLPYVCISNGRFLFKEQPPPDKEDEFVQALRAIIDFLVKKAVEEMGSSWARVKVQVVIEKMKQAS